MQIDALKHSILNGKLINRLEAITVSAAPLDALCAAADEIRRRFCGDVFDICTIINAKSGRCSEDCKYCAQSAFYNTSIEEHSLLDVSAIVAQARYNHRRGVLRYSIVTSGRTLTDAEADTVCESVRDIRAETGIEVCSSLGLLTREQFHKLKAAGVSRIHNNLETSRRNFPSVCTTHGYDDKVIAIRAAQDAGLNVCSGGIMGLGETMEDRVDMALDLRKLGVRSIPINMLYPIPGTPYANNPRLTNDAMCRIVAVFRFILPNAFIRLAGGRGLLPDKGRRCFQSGANAAISGDMLTTSGIAIDKDMKMIEELGYKVALGSE